MQNALILVTYFTCPPTLLYLFQTHSFDFTTTFIQIFPHMQPEHHPLLHHNIYILEEPT